jgi:hypothetical protein
MSPGTEGKSLISELEMVSISVSVSGPVLQLRQLNMKRRGGAELQVDWLPVTTDTSICKCFPERERESVCVRENEVLKGRYSIQMEEPHAALLRNLIFMLISVIISTSN